MTGPEFNLKGLNFWVGKPEDLEIEHWQQIQSIAKLAFTASFGRVDEAGIDHLLHIGDVERFRDGRIDPQVDVADGRLNNGEFSFIRIALALNGEEIVGETLVADNTSGPSEFIRHTKMRISPSLPIPKFGQRRYAWIRETVVRPDFQHRGIAHTLGYRALHTRHPRQPVSTYEWDATYKDSERLESLGFKFTGGNLRKPFGNDQEVYQSRFQAKRAGRVKDGIASINRTASSAIASTFADSKLKHRRK